MVYRTEASRRSTGVGLKKGRCGAPFDEYSFGAIRGERCAPDVYKVMLFVLVKVFYAFYFAGWGFFIGLIVSIVSSLVAGHSPSPVTFGSGAGGIFAGVAFSVYPRLEGLWEYKAACEKLRLKIARLKQELGIDRAQADTQA